MQRFVAGVVQAEGGIGKFFVVEISLARLTTNPFSARSVLIFSSHFWDMSGFSYEIACY